MTNPLSVLVVDDEPLLAKSIARYLEASGLSAETCGDGNTAMELLTAHPFDVLVTDMELPNGGGERLLEYAQESGCGCRIIVISGQAAEEKASAHPHLDVTYLAKPFDLDVLVELVTGTEHVEQESGRTTDGMF